MADTEGTSPAPSNPPLEPPPAQAKPVAPAPRVNPPNINASKEPEPAAPPGLNDFLEWMRKAGMGSEAAPAAANQRPLIPKERKKFQRRDSDVKTDGPAGETATPAPEVAPRAEAVMPVPASVTEKPATAAELEKTAPPAAPLAGSLEAATPRVRRGQQTAAKQNSWLGLPLQLAIFALLIGAFILGRMSVKQVVAPPPAAPAAPEILNKEGKATTKLLSDANAALIDQAMAAEQASDFKKATALLEKVRDSGEHVAGLTFQLAQLAIFANDYTHALPLLNQALTEADSIGEAYNLRATMASRMMTLGYSAMNDYETATKLEPFNSRNFFYWGAAQRRAGMPRAALGHLQQALDRLREPTAESYYKLAIRLALIQLNEEAEFADELKAQLASPVPDMDWLFTAAAIDIRDGNFASAAKYLERASRCGDADGYSMRMRDYSFYQHRFEKELSRFYKNLSPVRPDVETAPPVPGEVPPPNGSPAAANASAPAIGLEVPVLPPPALPGATVVPPH